MSFLHQNAFQICNPQFAPLGAPFNLFKVSHNLQPIEKRFWIEPSGKSYQTSKLIGQIFKVPTSTGNRKWRCFLKGSLYHILYLPQCSVGLKYFFKKSKNCPKNPKNIILKIAKKGAIKIAIKIARKYSVILM